MFPTPSKHPIDFLRHHGAIERGEAVAVVGDDGAPFNVKFNVAVRRMAELVCPAGYDVLDNGAPYNLQSLNDYVRLHHRIGVSRRYSDNTIFGCPETNWAFRAWHDWTHFIIQAPFTLDGELAVAHRQIEDLVRVYGHGAETRDFAKLIMCEVYGQASYHVEHGEFPADQRAFTRNWLASH